MKQNDLQLLLALTYLTFVNATNKPSSDWPVLVFKEGATAHLPCPPQGHANAFFWRKGDWFNVSENIASIVHGIADTTEKYDVLGDGTLVIMDMSFDDEGKYYCRIASETNECHGSITLYLEVSAEAFDIAIEGCTASSSCVKFQEPSLEVQLTCTANRVAESMTLKWYSGSKEIIGNVDVSETFGRKAKVTNVIKFMFEEESHFTCEAEGVNIARSKAAIQLKKKEVFIPVENEDAFTLLVPTIVLGIICLTLTSILTFLIVRQRKLNKEQGKAIDAHSIEMDQTGAGPANGEKEEQNSEEDPLFTSKEENNTDLAKKEGELPKLREEIKTKNEKLIEKDKDVEKLREEIDKKNKNLTEKDEKVERLQTELKETKNALEENKRELVKATTVLQKKGTEAKQLKATDKQKVTADITIVNLQKDLQEANAKFLTSENEKKNLQKQAREANAKLSASEDEKKKSSEQLAKVQTELQIAKAQLGETQSDLQNAKTDLLEANADLQKMYSETIYRTAYAQEDSSQRLPRIIIRLNSSQLSVKEDTAIYNLLKSNSNVAYYFGPASHRETLREINIIIQNFVYGGRYCIIAFGSDPEHIKNTMYDENSGLIALVVNNMKLLVKNITNRGFKVECFVNVFKVQERDSNCSFIGPEKSSQESDTWKFSRSREITIEKFPLLSQTNILHIILATIGNLQSNKEHGVVRFTLETFLKSHRITLGGLMIASIHSRDRVHLFCGEKTENEFAALLKMYTHDPKGKCVVIANCSEQHHGEMPKMIEATKKVMAALTP